MDTAVQNGAAGALVKQPSLSEAMIISTCNRLEVYTVTNAFHAWVGDVLRVLADVSGVDAAELRRLLEVLRAEEKVVGGSDDAVNTSRETSRLANLEDLIAQLRSIGLDVDVQMTGTARELDPSVDLAAYRVVQEALTNVNKHAGTGTSQHIGGEMLAQMAGIELTGVAYNDPAAQVLDVQTGRVTMGFQSGVVALPRVRDNTWRALAVSSAARMGAAPDLPTVGELGLAGFDAAAWLAIFAPAGTPDPVIMQVQRDVVAAMAEPELRARMQDLGIERVGSTSDELRDLVTREIPRMATVLQRAGIRPE